MLPNKLFTKTLTVLFILVLLSSCKQEIEKKIILKNDYFDSKTEGKFQAGGVKMITLKEGYKVWTKRIGKFCYCMAVRHSHMSIWNVLKAFFQKKASSFTIMTNWVPIVRINQKMTAFGL